MTGPKELERLRSCRSVLLVPLILALVVLAAGCGEVASDPEASAPGPSLPFPEGQVNQVWQVEEHLFLVELVNNMDNSFHLYHEDEGREECIVTFVENATYYGTQDETLRFIAKNDYDTGDYEFPRVLLHSIHTGEQTSEDLFLPLMQPVALGKSGWNLVLTGCEVNPGELVFEFAPRADAVLAGGFSRPRTTVRSLEGEEGLRFRFYSMEIGENALGDALPALEGVPAIMGVEAEELSGREVPADDAALFAEAFPYGLESRDPPSEWDGPVLEVVVRTKGAECYNVESSVVTTEDGSGIMRYVVRFEP